MCGVLCKVLIGWHLTPTEEDEVVVSEPVTEPTTQR